MKRLAVLLFVILSGTSSAGDFGRMFPSLLPYVTPSDSDLSALALSMQDPNLDEENNPLGLPSGFTYLGQFLDHDLTLDVTPLNMANDVANMINARTARLDLDSVYGGGPTLSPQFYAPDGSFLLAEPNGFPDYPRDPTGKAIINEARNDENLVIAQIQIAFMRFHNLLIERGLSFNEAHQRLACLWQWIVVHEVLPHFCGQQVVDRFLRYNGAGKPKYHGDFYSPGAKHDPMMPLEFSAAAYRFGHSMVRLAYVLPTGSITKTQVFNAAGTDLHGGRPIPPLLKVDFLNFFDFAGVTAPPLPTRNVSRKIDALISKSLYVLPVGSVVPGTDTPLVVSLPERNLLRGKRLGLPSYQTTAIKMGLVPLTNAELGITNPALGLEAPLWFGILKESSVKTDGATLGPVGGRIIADVILGIIDADDDSYFNVHGRAWSPNAAGQFGIADLLSLSVEDPL